MRYISRTSEVCKSVNILVRKHEEKSPVGRRRYVYENIYLLNPWSRVLLEKLTGSAASQEITRIFGTRRFLTVLTSARNLSLS